MALKIYQYPRCGTCKKALRWLDERGVSYQAIDIVTSPPSRAELARAQKLAGLPIRKLFNTSGQSYRQGGFRDRLDTMSEGEALDALAADGKLIKRPLVLGKDVALVGFQEGEWSRVLGHGRE